MADDGGTSKGRARGRGKQRKAPALLGRILRRLESKRRRTKREDPNIYPLF